MAETQYRFWIDRGGTFTDVVAVADNGSVQTLKLLSENPEQYEDAVLEGIRRVLGGRLEAHRIKSVRMGTTVATNALLERKGARTGLLVTKGLRDVLEIGTQARPDIFALKIEKPIPLYETVLEIDERISANGAVVRALDSRAARAGLLRLREAGITSLAIVLLHSWIDPAHELELAELAREVGFEHVTTSGACGALIKLVPRGRTAVLDAYLSPVLQAYIDRVASALAGVGELLFMQSSGGLADRAHFAGRNAVLSGPAGGVVGAIETARQAGFDKIIGFDMGGTSTDVCHYGGRYERAEEAELAGVTVRVPMLDIHTVAAGGGSVLSYDGARFQVGPESAGASPGPACYGRGGPLAVTDIHAVLGRLQAEHFPRIFGPDQNAPLDIEAARDKFSRLAERAGLSVEATAEGFLKIAITHMAGAIKEITTGRGIDLEGYTLVSFGGAGGQHACLVAEALGLERIFIHPLAGVLSALGIGLSGLSATRQKTVGLPLEQMETARAEAALLLEDVKAELRAQGVNEQEVEGQIWAGLRYDNADTVLELDFGEDLHAAFERAHKRRFGFIDERAKILIESLRVEGRSLGSALPEIPPKSGNRDVPAPVRLYAKGAWHTAPVLWRDQLEVGKEIVGPAVILDQGGTNIIEPGWVAVLNDTGGLVAERRSRTAKKQTKKDTASDPVRLELFNQMFMAVARRMGAVLGQTARSVNIKERLDYSCAVFDAQGGLVANAPHMPVHIGSMDLSVRAVIRSGLPIRPGMSFVHNNPYAGGTHLPDINVITPVFDPHGEEVLFYVCARGHHADIGGLAPGSMSPLATTIEEEGVVIDVMPLVEDGRFLEAEMMEVLKGARYPARNPAQNIADLKAQLAANATGAAELLSLCARYGTDVVQAYMRHCQDDGERAVRRAISSLKDGDFTLALDQGSRICVRIRVNPQAGSALIDFAGTDPQRPDNFNAPEAVTRAAVLYVFRCLVGRDIPLNAGCLKPLDIRIPKGSLLSAQSPAAIVAGNVELSQCVTNALFGALGVLGSSQCTMNNLTFGNAKYQYYETICSGAPAGLDHDGEGFDGVAAVQTHMTNSHLTDPEVLESRFPVRLKTFKIRRGSGGKGRWCAGDGVRREIEFLEPMQVAILSGNRKVAPFGLKGGAPGQLGVNKIRRKGGAVERLPGCARADMGVGDMFVVETPTGGGYGRPEDKG